MYLFFSKVDVADGNFRRELVTTDKSDVRPTQLKQ
jgi:hypothetical protein